MTALLPALAGANLIYGAGMLEAGITMGYGQLVMDNEFHAMIRHALKGIVVDDESLACDLIKEIGPGGNHLTADLTLAHVRGYQSTPELIDRTMYDSWVLEGSGDLKTRCDEKARHILENHTPTPLSDYASGTINEIIAKEERDLGIV